MAKIKRSLVATFIDSAPTAETYVLLGFGITTGMINYNPKVTEETYINQDSASIAIDSYAPKMSVEATAIVAEPAFEYIDALRIARAVLSDAETTIVNVWNYVAGGPAAAPAEQQAVSISIESFGGDGGEATKINFSINYIGDPIPGTFNLSTKVFSAT